MSTNLHSQAAGAPLRRSVSILIPVFNNDCTPLVEDLVAQAEKLQGVAWEVCVAEDGSTDAHTVAANSVIAQWPHCRHLVREANVGRARIRNLLGREARHEWVLFIDSHMRIGKADFIATYLSAPDGDVVDGDYTVVADAQQWSDSLRYRYEYACEWRHTPEARRKQPYASFHTANFLIRRALFLAHPFEESFSEYGYEDVLFGVSLAQHGIRIQHIDNPVEFRYFESNSRFMEKTEAAMRSLSRHQALLQGQSRLLKMYRQLSRCQMHRIVALLFKWRGQRWKEQLVSGEAPSLRLFNLYRLGYLCHWSLKGDTKKP